MMDAGAEVDGYASDITRTWPVSGKFSDAQRTLYELVLDINKKCIEVKYFCVINSQARKRADQYFSNT